MFKPEYTWKKTIEIKENEPHHIIVNSDHDDHHDDFHDNHDDHRLEL